MEGYENPRRFQFNLKTLLLAVTVIFLSLPLLPVALAFAIWYVVSPEGAMSDVAQWIFNRPLKTRRD